MAEGLELGHQWEVPAAQRLRFVLNFAYATGLRISELVSATQGQIEVDGHGDHWLHLVGKGSKATKVALPPLARAALDRYLMQRELPITPAEVGSANAIDRQASNPTAARQASPRPGSGVSCGGQLAAPGTMEKRVGPMQ